MTYTVSIQHATEIAVAVFTVGICLAMLAFSLLRTVRHPRRGKQDEARWRRWIFG